MLDTIRKELIGLKEVHKVLSDRQDELDNIGKQKFIGMDTKVLGKTLREMEDDLGKLPNKIRQYQAYNKFVSTLKNKQKMNKNIFGDLSCGVLRQKHWNEVDKVLNLKKNNNTNVVEPNDLLKFAKPIADIVTVARGESNVENFLNEINEKWNKTFFELVDYKGKCPLVKNWTELREDVGEALTNVMSMKQSPFYKAFEREGSTWDEKLNAAQAIFDVMVDVQRRWVYLQGVFNNSADVQKSLGYMYQKFKGFDREFVQLMRGIKQDPLVDHWVTAEKNLLQMLEANQNTLNTIQKALNEYLESQRSAFARFYFIGDEDLLEIIGSSKDPRAINRHLAKMFAGIAQIRLHPENESIILGMASREAEEVIFKQPIDVNKSERIQDWLLQVEHQMRFTLASLLEEAVATFVSPDDIEAYFAWVGRYPAQVALLATQIRWSETVDNNLKKLSKDPNQENHNNMEKLLQEILSTLEILANRVLGDIPPKIRKLYEQLITELVYQRDVTRTLIKEKICTETDFKWLYRMRFYWNRVEKDVLRKLEIRISRAKFYYGFEYFGATEKLVQTPLTDKAYLTLCEALHAKLGGNPFGPAGTGKTESVKALGAQLGRFVLVFCCDETFDYNAMSRIFVGLCQCGAWGCFDEFNRLEEQILSAVSQQILTIQTGLRENSAEINLSTSRGIEK
ncbi:cytoplasmic dynein heavy chain, partial [Reticulomyxa filosa]